MIYVIVYIIKSCKSIHFREQGTLKDLGTNLNKFIEFFSSLIEIIRCSQKKMMIESLKRITFIQGHQILEKMETRDNPL